MSTNNPIPSEDNVKWPTPLERWEWAFAKATEKGLSPAASLMLQRAAYKDGNGNGFYESIPSMVRAMPMHETTIRRGLVECVKAGLLSAETSQGRHYDLLPVDGDWRGCYPP